MALQVTVTGGTGFIAGALIQQLLDKGYTVHATVRSTSPTNPKIQHLLRLAAALPGDLRLFEADLLVPGAFDAAVAGSVFVFHVASAVVCEVEDNQRDLIDPAVKGTENVMASILKSKGTVRRVILTSSVLSMMSFAPDAPPARNGQLYTEEDWNETSTIEAEPYALSKVLAEKVAWGWSKKTGIPLVTICPSFVIGPMLYAGDSFTPKFMQSVFEGPMPTVIAPFVDVRDVARAHVLAAEVPTASGRYIVASPAAFNLRWLLHVFKERFPAYNLQDCAATSEPWHLDVTKGIRELGLHYHPMKETVIDMAVSIMKLGIIKPKL